MAAPAICLYIVLPTWSGQVSSSKPCFEYVFYAVYVGVHGVRVRGNVNAPLAFENLPGVQDRVAQHCPASSASMASPVLLIAVHMLLCISSIRPPNDTLPALKRYFSLSQTESILTPFTRPCSTSTQRWPKNAAAGSTCRYVAPGGSGAEALAAAAAGSCRCQNLQLQSPARLHLFCTMPLHHIWTHGSRQQPLLQQPREVGRRLSSLPEAGKGSQLQPLLLWLGCVESCSCPALRCPCPALALFLRCAVA